MIFATFAISAAAQSPVPRVASYCSSEAAFGQKFGANRLENEGAGINFNNSRRAFAPRGGFAPFSTFDGGFTPKSHRLHSAQGTILLASREASRAVFESIVAELSADARFSEKDIPEPDVSPSGAVWRTAKFYAGNSRPDADKPIGLRISVYFMERVSAESSIAMDCMDAEIARTAEREALID
ncbi:MAG: hypothetical protein QM773_04210 [Hyphomonadaceae bacterium]